MMMAQQAPDAPKFANASLCADEVVALMLASIWTD